MQGTCFGWILHAHPEEAGRLRSKDIQSTTKDTVVSSEVGGKRGGSTNQEGLSGVDQHGSLNLKDNNSTSSICSTAKKGRNATTKSATSKPQVAQKKGEQGGRSKVKGLDGSTTIFSTGTRSARVTRSQTQISKTAKSSDSSTSKSRKKTVGSTIVRKIITRSSKGCNHPPSPAPESDTAESLDISSDYEEGECLSTILYCSS